MTTIDPLSVFLIIIGIVLCIAAAIRHVYGYWRAHKIPYAQPICFPYGSIKGAMSTEHISDILVRYYTQFKGRSLPFIGIFFLLKRVILAVDIDFIKRVLIKDFQYFENRGGFYNERDDPLSAHLFILETDTWRRVRAQLTPTFTSGKMKNMFDSVRLQAKRFGQVLSDQVTQRPDAAVEMRELVGRFMVDVIGTTAFGIECNSIAAADSEDAKFLRMGRKMLDQPRHHALVTITSDTYPQLARAIGMRTLPDDVGAFFMNMVRQTVAYRETNDVRRNDFMDLLMRLKNDVPKRAGDRAATFNEIAAQAFVFFMAGFGMSSITMTFALYELAANPMVQRRVRAEIAAVLRQHDGEFPYEAMAQMTYLDQTINETLRKYPPVPLLNRQTSKEYYVPEYDYTIPKDTPIWIPALAIHMDPDFYPNPERFEPERFSAEEVRKRNPITFMPFGDGPRNCIGMRFGMMQVRVGLVELLRRFQFNIRHGETTHPMRISKTDILLTPEGGSLWLEVVKLPDLADMDAEAVAA